jgi:hypothetical protein
VGFAPGVLAARPSWAGAAAGSTPVASARARWAPAAEGEAEVPRWEVGVAAVAGSRHPSSGEEAVLLRLPLLLREAAAGRRRPQAEAEGLA